jgi:uncharacterized protein
LHHLKRGKLKLVNQYIIPFTGLKDGDHEFSFELGKEFFDLHEVLEIRNGNVKTAVSLNRKLNLITLEVAMNGYLELQCDRCLDSFRFPISYNGNLVVKFGEDTSASTDEIWILPPNEHTLNLEQFFYDCIGLCIPIQRKHPDNSDGSSGCNPDMIEIIRFHSMPVKNKVQDETDPRWNKLKDLLNDINTN